MRARRRRWLVVLLGVLLAGLWLARCRDAPTTRLAAFNIEMFPNWRTDLSRVAGALAEVNADVVALQEMRDPVALQWVLRDASQRTGREYRHALSTCLDNGSPLVTGLIWDASRWALVELRHYPGLEPDGDGACGRWQAAVLGVFEDRAGTRVAVLSVHLQPLPDRYDQRKLQWPRVLQIQARVRAELGIPVVALGDYNSTGFIGDPAEERAFIEDAVDSAGYALLSADIDCTAYWRPGGGETMHPSVLDHVVATHGDWTPARALGMCRRLACESASADEMDADYSTVSDHCPVVIDGRP